MDSFSNSCYHYEEEQNATYIADEESYEKCLKLRTKASELFSDEYTRKQLEDAQNYGKKTWNDWNKESIKSLSVYGILFAVLMPPVGFLLLIIDAILIHYSYRPYWQINRTYVTGQMGKSEEIVSKLGEYAARFSVWFLRFVIKFVTTVIKFTFGVAFR